MGKNQVTYKELYKATMGGKVMPAEEIVKVDGYRLHVNNASETFYLDDGNGNMSTIVKFNGDEISLKIFDGDEKTESYHKIDGIINHEPLKRIAKKLVNKGETKMANKRECLDALETAECYLEIGMEIFKAEMEVCQNYIDTLRSMSKGVDEDRLPPMSKGELQSMLLQNIVDDVITKLEYMDKELALKSINKVNEAIVDNLISYGDFAEALEKLDVPVDEKVKLECTLDADGKVYRRFKEYEIKINPTKDCIRLYDTQGKDYKMIYFCPNCHDVEITTYETDRRKVTIVTDLDAYVSDSILRSLCIEIMKRNKQ